MSMTKVESGMIDTLDASKLTGAMPAMDGSALTGIDALPAAGTSGNVLTSDGANWASGAAPSGGTDNGPFIYLKQQAWQFPSGDNVNTVLTWEQGYSKGDWANLNTSNWQYYPQVSGNYFVWLGVQGYAGLQGNASNFHSLYISVMKNGGVYHERGEDDYNGYATASRMMAYVASSAVVNIDASTNDYISAKAALNTYSGTPNKTRQDMVIFRIADY
jgi:hypothetical protein